MCAICLTTFDTEEQWRDHEDFGTCSDRTTPVKLKRKSKKKRRRLRRYCHTCRTLFNSERSNDVHEPCPNSKVPKGGVMYIQKIKADATREQQGVSTVVATPKTPVRPRKRKCGGQEKGSQIPDRKTKHVDETKNHCPSDEFQIDHTQKTLQLPKGASSFIMTHPESGQPTRIKLPPTKPNQNWCTVRVNIPERQFTCPD